MQCRPNAVQRKKSSMCRCERETRCCCRLNSQRSRATYIYKQAHPREHARHKETKKTRHSCKKNTTKRGIFHVVELQNQLYVTPSNKCCVRLRLLAFDSGMVTWQQPTAERERVMEERLHPRLSMDQGTRGKLIIMHGRSGTLYFQEGKEQGCILDGRVSCGAAASTPHFEK